MSNSTTALPHPVLTSNILYIARAPARVQRKDLENVLERCGRIVSLAKIESHGTHATWKMQYQSVWNAEMALATLHGTVMESVNPTWNVQLSHNQSLDPPIPEESKRVLPQFVKCTGDHTLQAQNAQALFALFRIVGPLVSVRADVDVGYPTKTCIVEYWDASHARLAQSEVLASINKVQVNTATLQAFDPYDIFCSNLETSVTEDMLRGHFAEFQDIVNVRLRKTKNGAGRIEFGFVTFDTEEQAAAALRRMNGTFLGSRKIGLRYSEKKDLKPPPRPKKTNKKEADKQEKSPNSQDPAPGKVETKEPERDEKKDEEHKRELQNRLRAATQKRLWAEQEEKKAQTAEQVIEQEEVRLQAALGLARKSHSATTAECEVKEQEVTAAQKAREEAERREADLREEQQQLKALLKDYLEKIEEITEQVKGIIDKKETAQKVEQEARELRETAVDEEQRLTEETRKACRTREDELVDSIRKIQELKKMEEEHRQRRMAKDAQEKQAKAEQQAKQAEEKRKEAMRKAKEAEARQIEAKRKAREAEERMKAEREAREAREREEQERMAREAREREGRERVAREARERGERERIAREEAQRAKEQEEREKAEQRKKLYEEAVARERARCRKRDQSLFFFRSKILWSHWHALERFRKISEEFDSIKFCEEQPLTLESVPWPLLHYPDDLTTDLIEWSAVENFFKSVKPLIDASEYKTLVEKTHRRFHPDKWKSRRLVATILDEALREKLEAAGNTVAQALTPLWLASKGM